MTKHLLAAGEASLSSMMAIDQLRRKKTWSCYNYRNGCSSFLVTCLLPGMSIHSVYSEAIDAFYEKGEHGVAESYCSCSTGWWISTMCTVLDECWIDGLIFEAQRNIAQPKNSEGSINAQNSAILYWEVGKNICRNDIKKRPANCSLPVVT